MDGTTITNWELNATVPAIRYIPAVIRFLGYDPFPATNSLSERLTAMRKALGLSQERMAEKLGVDEGTLQGWEAGKHQPTKKSLEAIERVIRR